MKTLQSSYSHAGQDIHVYELIAGWRKKPKEIVVMEVGARDGFEDSNSRLFRENGFTCLLGEANKQFSDSLLKLKSENCLISNEPIDYLPGGLDSYVDKNFDGKSPDILFFDIDGGEYHLIESSSLFPEIVCVEYNRNLMPNSMFVSKNIVHGYLKQASPLAIAEMMLKRGYNLSSIFWNDLIFVKSLEPKLFEDEKWRIIDCLIADRLLVDPFFAFIKNGYSYIDEFLHSLEEEGGESDVKAILSHLQLIFARLRSSSVHEAKISLEFMLGKGAVNFDINAYNFIIGQYAKMMSDWKHYV